MAEEITSEEIKQGLTVIKQLVIEIKQLIKELKEQVEARTG